jgi:hypothetical protein
MILVAIAILVGVFFAATGRGGELAYEVADHAPLDLGPVSATDVALLRPPTALWGYNMQVTDEAMERIAQAIRDRDVTIAFLQQRLADLTAPDAPVLDPVLDPVLEPAEAPPVHLAQHARPAAAGEPSAPEDSPEPSEPADSPVPADSQLTVDSPVAADEQSW